MIFFLAGSRVVSWVGPQWKYSSPLPHITCIICLRNVNLAVTGEQDFISKTNFRLHISDYRFYLNIGRSHQWWLRMEQVWVLYSALREFKNVDTDDKFYRVFTSSVTRRSRLTSCLFQLILHRPLPPTIKWRLKVKTWTNILSPKLQFWGKQNY